MDAGDFQKFTQLTDQKISANIVQPWFLAPFFFFKWSLGPFYMEKSLRKIVSILFASYGRRSEIKNLFISCKNIYRTPKQIKSGVLKALNLKLAYFKLLNFP